LLTAAEPAALSAKTCPACAEEISVNAHRCPHCGEDISKSVPAEAQAAALGSRIQEIEAYAKDANATLQDHELKGGFLSTKSKVILAFEALGVLCFIAGLISGQNAVGLTVTGIILMVVFAIPVIVTLVNDAASRNIQEASTANKALKNYFTAVATGRYKPAFVALAPSARGAKHARSIVFKNKKIPTTKEQFSISDPKTLGRYWASVFSGPSGTTRQVQVKSTKIVRESDGVAIVEAELHCTSYGTWLLLTIFISVLICVILILVLQQKETITIRKLLIKRGGRWFLAESELQGPLDRLNIKL
jgi:hypothetical protein